MAATVTYPAGQQTYQSIGSLLATVIDVTLATNDYVTGGIDFSSLLPGGKDFIGAVVISSTGAGAVVQIPSVDKTNKKLQLVIGTAGVNTEAANGTSTAQVVRLLALSA